jgi:hypothetical protein
MMYQVMYRVCVCVCARARALVSVNYVVITLMCDDEYEITVQK